MSKELAIIVILVVSAVAFASARPGNSTEVAVQDDGKNSHNIIFTIIENVLSIPLDILSMILSPATGVLDLIVTFVEHLVKNVFTLITDILSFILSPAAGPIGLALAVLRFIYHELRDGGVDVYKLVSLVIRIIWSVISGIF